jgi:hypothetical protein
VQRSALNGLLNGLLEQIFEVETRSSKDFSRKDPEARKCHRLLFPLQIAENRGVVGSIPTLAIFEKPRLKMRGFSIARPTPC